MIVKFAIPFVFLVLWSTGFVGAKYGLPSAEPFTFLGIRMFFNLVALAFIVPWFKVTWPTNWIGFFHLGLVGVLIHGFYLGGVFSAIHYGLPASLTAVIVGLQPLLTAIIAYFWLSESLTKMKIVGLMIGFIGIVLVVFEREMNADSLLAQIDSDYYVIGVLFCIASLFGISLGTLYQKRFCGDFDLLPGVCIQYAANGVFMAILAFSLETRVVQWDMQFILALGWLVLVLSIGAVLLLMWLIRQGEASRVASLFYLVPALVTIETWYLFDEQFGNVAIFGIACCVLGVAMVLKSPSKLAT